MGENILKLWVGSGGSTVFTASSETHSTIWRLPILSNTPNSIVGIRINTHLMISSWRLSATVNPRGGLRVGSSPPPPENMRRKSGETFSRPSHTFSFLPRECPEQFYQKSIWIRNWFYVTFLTRSASVVGDSKLCEVEGPRNRATTGPETGKGVY